MNYLNNQSVIDSLVETLDDTYLDIDFCYTIKIVSKNLSLLSSRLKEKIKIYHFSDGLIHIKDLSMIVKNYPNITELDISGRQIPMNDMDFVIYEIQKLIYLQSLNVELASLSDSAVLKIITLKSLKELYIGLNNFDHDGIKYICTLSNLDILDLRYSPIDNSFR